MNAAGICVFYGATDIETCISEVRPAVGSLVVVGQFQLLRPLKVLDMTVLDKAFASLSYFEPDFTRVNEQRAFLRSFHSEISSRVVPSEQELAFIPTQVVAEFLAHRHEPKLDGVLYRSTQAGGNGLNVALFYHASLVEGAEDERSSTAQPVIGELTWQQTSEDDFSEVFWISEAKATATDDHYEFDDEPEEPTSDIQREPALRLVQDSLKMFRVTASKFDHDDIDIVDFRKHKPADDII